MAKYLLTNGKVFINGKDLSDHAFSIDTPDEREEVDVSGFSPSGTREFLPGVRDQTITIAFLTSGPRRCIRRWSRCTAAGARSRCT